jgi:hypothetical protein
MSEVTVAGCTVVGDDSSAGVQQPSSCSEQKGQSSRSSEPIIGNDDGV